MSVDRLSEVLDLVEVCGVASGGFAARGRWFTRGEVHIPLKLIAMVYGQAQLTTDGVDAPVLLRPGDVAVLNGRSWLELKGGTGDSPQREILPEEDFSSARLRAADGQVDDVVVGGRIDIAPAGRALLLNALEPVTHIRAAADAAPLHDILRRLLDEVTGRRVGSAFAIRQHGQLLLLEVLRAYVSRTDLPPGWLSVLKDAQLRPALDLIHDHPEKPWGLQDLARAAAMSRTSFAERFRKTAGTPPLTYLSQWRMLLARRSLRDSDVRISTLAFELGYASESTFSTAFKRVVGESPQRYRRRLDTA
ncbi:AraC family transcriptional regulator [Phytohabitans kaempferiae]|uniref:AraC family transcriptional regulator n=1 Tax=Phytohabitans kaempferiae TaxID=1620943 RepID=A0ABV6MD53_9ACTN